MPASNCTKFSPWNCYHFFEFAQLSFLRHLFLIFKAKKKALLFHQAGQSNCNIFSWSPFPPLISFLSFSKTIDKPSGKLFCEKVQIKEGCNNCSLSRLMHCKILETHFINSQSKFHQKKLWKIQIDLCFGWKSDKSSTNSMSVYDLWSSIK